MKVKLGKFGDLSFMNNIQTFSFEVNKVILRTISTINKI